MTALPASAAAGVRGHPLSEALVRLLASLIVAVLCAVLIVLPLYAVFSKSVQDAGGHFVGLANFIEYARNPGLQRALYNSVFVSVVTALVTVPLAFGYAYALTRSCMPAKGLFKTIALLPILAPSLLPALSLTYIFGNQGFLKAWLFGNSIYGPIGILLAQIFHCFPIAVIVLITALSLTDARLYEVAETLATSRWRVFHTITLPAARYGLVSAAVVVFTTAIVDFGIAKVIGGKYNVLAIEVYRQIIGQQNFAMGAVVGVVLFLPASLSFIVERIVQRKQSAQLSSRSVIFRPKPHPAFDAAMLAVASFVSFLILAVLAVAIFASLVKLWPYDLSLSLASYHFATFDPAGWWSYVNSIILASWTAVTGTALIFVGAYLVEKGRRLSLIRAVIHAMAMIPLAVPGVVLGLGYIFFFNAPQNPLNVVYGTMAILVLCTVAHYYTVPHLTALLALKQIDREFETASDALGVPFWVTFRRVTLPICAPAIWDIATFLFVNAMTTVAAVIFLYAPGTKLAAVAVVEMDDTGDIGAACAMALMILYTSIAVKTAQWLVAKYLFERAQSWRRPAAD
ncbi:MAG: putative 2-aminoethylphosphonate ABC transporter permease subunit [Alphaproteobacteria bacterium]